MTTSWRPAELDRPRKDDPACPQSGASLRLELEDVAPPDDEFTRHVAAAIVLLHSSLSGRPSPR